jgi:NAD(P)-dependent dehydrogenase (short-subunit alcohol dehydrogenase family)
MKTILITGATDGLGKELAIKLSRKYQNIIVHGRNKQKGNSLLKELRIYNPTCKSHFLKSNYASLDEVRLMSKQIKRLTKSIDVIINNVGTRGTPDKEITLDNFNKTIQINFISHFHLVKNLLPLLVLPSTKTKIINISSSAQIPFLNEKQIELSTQDELYAISKYMMSCITYFSADLFKKINCSIISIHPGSVMPTKMTTGIQPRDSISFGVQNVLNLIAMNCDEINGQFIYKDISESQTPIIYSKIHYLRILNYLRNSFDENCI